MSSEFHLVAIFTLKAGAIEPFLAEVKKITKTVQETEPNVLRYFGFQTKSDDGNDQVVFVEKYDSQETFEAHGKTAHFQSFAATLPQFLEKPFELKLGSQVAGFEGR